MKYEVCVCKISMEWKIGCLHGGIKTVSLHHLINHNINLSDPWLRTVNITLFRQFGSSQKVKHFNNFLRNISNSIGK